MTAEERDAVTLVVDARGRRCPQPVIDLARAAASAAPGTVIEVLATDPAARHDVPAWCRLRGHALVDIDRVDGGSEDSSDGDSSDGGSGEPVWSIRVRLSRTASGSTTTPT